MKRAIQRREIVRIQRVPKTMQTATTLGAMEPFGAGGMTDVDDMFVESKDVGREQKRRTTARRTHAMTKVTSSYRATPMGLQRYISMR